ncbi:MAG: NAD(P)-dependent alcohol dehydrogenase [Caldilineaceae bacterium]|nr:NAD(P)-dependent alcohol dehydrogenase [Caldilineaceae bacterium]
MKAIIAPKYGSPDVLELRDVDKPTPKADEVLVKIHAAAVNAGDWHLLRADPFLIRLMYGLLVPKHPIIGSDMAGTVEAVGSAVTQFQVGDEVFGSELGAFAEYAAVPERRLALKPTGLSFEKAASVPVAAVTALQALRDHGQIAPGKKVLINGASGGVGTFAVQIAKAFGAEVTGVCSTGKMEMVRSIGADHVIDYTQEDFTKNGQRYDLILAANGYQPLSAYARALSPQGIYVMSGGAMVQLFEVMIWGMLKSKKGGKTFGNMTVKSSQEDLFLMKELIEAGKVVPVLDQRFPLSRVPDAIRYLEAGHAKGKVVISLDQPSA